MKSQALRIDKKHGVLKRFFKFVKMPQNKDECWMWTGASSSGPKSWNWQYGMMSVHGQAMGAHRVSYALFIGDIPEGTLVIHSCNQTKCVNPMHLRLGTAKENMQQCVQEGRFGARDNHRKLLAEEVAEIRATLRKNNSYGTQARLAREYAVRSSTISLIAQGKIWKGVGEGYGPPRRPRVEPEDDLSWFNLYRKGRR